MSNFSITIELSDDDVRWKVGERRVYVAYETMRDELLYITPHRRAK